MLGNLIPAERPEAVPQIAHQAEPAEWLHANLLLPFLEEVKAERLQEIDRISTHIEMSLTELLQKTDEEIGKAAAIEQGEQGAEGRLVMAESRHAELLHRRDRRRQELQRQKALSLQAIERITSVLVLPHSDREAPEVRGLNLRPDPETEVIAMQFVIDRERSRGLQVTDVHE